MELKELGNTGVMVPEIGLGTWRYSGGVEPLRKGIDLGAFLIDTAEMYRNEHVVGRAVKGICEQVFIATKVLGSHLRYDELIRSAEASLRALDVDCIDLYQIHWPNPTVPIRETMKAMERLVDLGLIKHIGVSNFSVGELREAQAAMTNYPIVSNQVLYNLEQRGVERDVLPYCQENHITIMAYTPLADGSLATSSRFKRNRRAETLKRVADQVDKTLAQVALNWCTSRSHVIAIPKSNKVPRIEENCRASDWRLSPDHIRLLDEAFVS